MKNFHSESIRTAQNIKERPAIYARADRARGRINLPGHAMAMFSEGLPTAVQGRLPHLTERTSFPLPSSGQATRPPGGSTAHLQLTENSTSYSLFATRGRLSRNRQLRLVENSNQHARMQAKNLWESGAFCGKTVLAQLRRLFTVLR